MSYLSVTRCHLNFIFCCQACLCIPCSLSGTSSAYLFMFATFIMTKKKVPTEKWWSREWDSWCFGIRLCFLDLLCSFKISSRLTATLTETELLPYSGKLFSHIENGDHEVLSDFQVNDFQCYMSSSKERMSNITFFWPNSWLRFLLSRWKITPVVVSRKRRFVEKISSL